MKKIISLILLFPLIVNAQIRTVTTLGGTLNYHPKFSSSSVIGNSLIYDNATSVGINTATFASNYALEVNGFAQIWNRIITGKASTSIGGVGFYNASNGNLFAIVSGATASSFSWTLPTAQGGTSTVLSNNGSGVLSWVTPSAGTVTSIATTSPITGGTITTTGTIACATCATASSLTTNTIPKISTSPGLSDSRIKDYGAASTITVIQDSLGLSSNNNSDILLGTRRMFMGTKSGGTYHPTDIIFGMANGSGGFETQMGFVGRESQSEMNMGMNFDYNKTGSINKHKYYDSTKVMSYWTVGGGAVPGVTWQYVPADNNNTTTADVWNTYGNPLFDVLTYKQPATGKAIKYFSITNTAVLSLADVTNTSSVINTAGTLRDSVGINYYRAATGHNMMGTFSVYEGASKFFNIDANGRAIFGLGSSSAGQALEVYDATEGEAIWGHEAKTTGNNYGVAGQASGSGATLNVGLYGVASGATTNYGLQIASPTASANNWALYSSAASKSYFAGSVGIGQLVPSYTLDVTGTIGASTSLTTPLINGTSSSITMNTSGVMTIAAQNAHNFTGTLTTTNTIGANMTYTTPVGAAYYQANQVILNGSFVGSGNNTIAGAFFNQVAGTGTALNIFSAFGETAGNTGLVGFATATTVGTNQGGHTQASGGNVNVGFAGTAVGAKNSATNIGIIAAAKNTGTSPVEIGLWATVNGTTTVPTTPTAILADNGASAIPVQIWRDNGTEIAKISDGGNLVIEGGFLYMKDDTTPFHYWKGTMTSGALIWTDTGSATAP